jgi:hypothetical protein
MLFDTTATKTVINLVILEGELGKYRPWIYQRWDQVTRQTQTLDIPEVGSGDQTNTDPGYTRDGIR